jgi:hypothetical protein
MEVFVTAVAAVDGRKSPRTGRTVKIDHDAARLLEAAAFVENKLLVDTLSDLVRTSLRSDPRVRAVVDAASALPTTSS